MKIKILGTNGWYSTETGNTICILIESKSCYVVLDAGEGMKNLDQHIKSGLPIFLFLSHFHFDHISGFHILNKFQFTQPMKIFGQPGTKDMLGTIIAHPYTLPPEELKTKIIIEELSEGINSPPLTPFPVECRFLVHWDPCFGYRLNVDGKVITYCTDTGACDNLLKLAQNADVLIVECTNKVGQTQEGFPHLTPLDGANIAQQTNAKKLLLTHFDAHNYLTLKEREKAEKLARKIFPNTNVCYDGMEVKI